MPAGQPPREPIETVQDWLDHVDKIRNAVRERAHLRLWFRGHGVSSWKLRPGVYRHGFATNEKERLHTERHLTQDFRVWSAGLRDPHMRDVDLYCLQQHYGMPTRLLDWTNDALAALYFAVSNEKHHKTDGAVVMMDAFEFQEGLTVATVRRETVREAVALIAEWPEEDSSSFKHLTFPFRPDRFNVRMSLQRAGFTFHVPKQPELTPAINKTLRTVPVAAGAKRQLKEQLAALGADDFGVYSDLESLSRHMKWAYGVRKAVP
jgi:hypothetical protein